MDNVTQLKTEVKMPADFKFEDTEAAPEFTTIAKPRLYRMQSECRLLSILLEHGVAGWEGYPLVLAEYRAALQQEVDD